MFGLTSVGIAILEMVEEERAWQRELAAMPEESRHWAIDRRNRAIHVATEERRHRELVEAQRNRSTDIFPFLFGFILGKS